MTLLPSPATTGELVLVEPDHRGGALAKALGARRTKYGGVRYFLTPMRAEKWQALYSAGYHAVKRGRKYKFTRNLRPLELHEAINEVRGTCSQ